MKIRALLENGKCFVLDAENDITEDDFFVWWDATDDSELVKTKEKGLFIRKGSITEILID